MQNSTRVENPAGLEAPGCVLLVLSRLGGECVGEEGPCSASSSPAVSGTREYQKGDMPLGTLKGQIFRINGA